MEARLLEINQKWEGWHRKLETSHHVPEMVLIFRNCSSHTFIRYKGFIPIQKTKRKGYGYQWPKDERGHSSRRWKRAKYRVTLVLKFRYLQCRQYTGKIRGTKSVHT